MSRKSMMMSLAILGMLFTAARIDVKEYTRWDKAYYLTPEQLVFIRPGLHLEVLSIEVEDRTVVVEFTVEDDLGQPLDLAGEATPGVIRTRFLLGTIPDGQTQYMSYITRTVTSPITNNSAVQPTSDSNGSYEKIADGHYRYRYGTMLPQGYDAGAPHTVGIYSDRNLNEFELGVSVDNDVVNFIPSGSPAPAAITEEIFRQLVLTENCNNCHNPLALHGGLRRETRLCIMCHYSGVQDPDTGNTVDFRVMIHRIHRGENLPSVEAGTPYQIIGFGGSVHDFSTVAFPQDIRNCLKCHGGAPQGLAYALRPNRATCGSCHDDVNFASGEGHPGGPALSDRFCANCHFPEGEFEFDQSILGAHTIPYRSRQLAGINIEILEVTNTGPGENPTVYFTVKDNAGGTIDISGMRSFRLQVAGPTTDYAFRSQEDARGAAPFMDGYTFTFAAAIPADAEGSFSIGAEASRNVILNPGTTLEREHRETAENPVFYFPVTDAEAVPRRTVVADARCERCHENLNKHGGTRHDPEYCVNCHNPLGTERPREGVLPRSIDFKLMIHRIHTGEELHREYTVGGDNFNELRFPGDRRDCNTCHEGESFQLPSRGVLSTPVNYEFFSPMPPTATACLGCHDSVDAAAHAFLNIAPFGEACAVCHGPSAEFAVSRVHAR